MSETTTDAIRAVFGLDGPAAPGAEASFPSMPIGQACDMGRAEDGTPLFDPRVLSSAEFTRDPYPNYRILRDHHRVFHDRLRNCYHVTRYADVASCYFDGLGYEAAGMSEPQLDVVSRARVATAGPPGLEARRARQAPA